VRIDVWLIPDLVGLDPVAKPLRKGSCKPCIVFRIVGWSQRVVLLILSTGPGRGALEHSNDLKALLTDQSQRSIPEHPVELTWSRLDLGPGKVLHQGPIAQTPGKRQSIQKVDVCFVLLQSYTDGQTRGFQRRQVRGEPRFAASRRLAKGVHVLYGHSEQSQQNGEPNKHA